MTVRITENERKPKMQVEKNKYNISQKRKKKEQVEKINT